MFHFLSRRLRGHSACTNTNLETSDLAVSCNRLSAHTFRNKNPVWMVTAHCTVWGLAIFANYYGGRSLYFNVAVRHKKVFTSRVFCRKYIYWSILACSFIQVWKLVSHNYRIGWWGRYKGLRGRKYKGTGGNCIMMSFWSVIWFI